MLDMKVEQRGIGGADNFTIFDAIIHNLNDNNISTGDIVIIGWSHPSRFRLEKNNKWLTIHNPQPIGGNLPINLIESYKFMDINTLEQIRANRLSPLYWDEVINWSRLLKIAFKLKGIKFLFWSPFVLGKDNTLKKQLLPDDWYIGTDIDRLHNETNRIIDDSHFSETGHKKLADILYQKIVSK
jgi:hypothetical protein